MINKLCFYIALINYNVFYSKTKGLKFQFWMSQGKTRYQFEQNDPRVPVSCLAYFMLETQPSFLLCPSFCWRVILLKLIQSLTLWHPKVEFQTLCFRVKNIIIYQSYIETEFINHIGPAQAPPFPYFLVVPNFGYVTR